MIKKFLLLGFFTFSVFTAKNVSREILHSDILYVKQISENNGIYTIIFRNQNNFEYLYISEDGDFYVNEIYSAILDKNGTEKIFDDKIVELKYQGEK